ncbi:tRNA1Val (adenine37-N6)-methyltransferase [Lacibacter cauensis]|uniref:tRNA1(Val) (adenine(37)-N6)-methyltransferase n=1 Tax=Lacibacter cauensis TaxID=510947 RepID=A0A562SW72_9BACT|nr:methyltransferase [Lacibacter cauensis]TWI85234.1 tRNA1Val (adenine37-N6)-methyltransferase [Lacibacter cauensis]
MPNHYFQFKQFTVQQEKAALKVSTDSCLFGAWIAEEVRSMKYEVRSVGTPLTTHHSPLAILDIGAGTGLLMLMLAQKNNAMIDGIEIDEPSYQQAKENIEASPWKERLQLFQADVKQFSFSKKYDLILSNPPFYEGDLKAGAANRNVAMHDAGLKLDELVGIVAANLTEAGSFAVLLPFTRAEYMIEKAATANLHLQKHVQVKQSVKHGYFRSMLLFAHTTKEPVVEELAIKDADNNYTVDFVNLLKDYYLYL